MPERIVKISPPGGAYRVIIDEGVLDRVGPLARELFAASRALLVSDTRVFALFGRRCLQSLESSGWQVSVSQIRPGERSKTLAGAGRLYDAAVAAGLDRGSPVIALGGGVVGDLAGFVAATYQRGIPLVAVPTTLLAQVDSSVGGKTAVNHPRGKNLIGAFHQPRLVAADPSALTELPLPLLKDGAAEVIKYAVIGDGPFFDWLEQNLERFWQRDLEALAEAVERSVRAKAAVVERDEQESDYRRILNFGHTVGHALEASTGYRYYRHGEAVLIGMAVAAELARQLGLLEGRPAARIQALLRSVGLKEPPAGLSAGTVMEMLRYDKKRRGDDLIFVLPRDIGTAVIQPVAETGLVEQLIRRCLAGGEPFYPPL